MTLLKTGLAAAALALAGAAPASALQVSYKADLRPLGPTSASGTASLIHDTETDMLWVRILAAGLDDGVHLQHIHGTFGPDGAPTDAMTPIVAEDDADGDGFVELAEGFPKYGPILLGLSDDAGGFPTSTLGELAFENTFDLSDPSIFADGFARDDLFPLQFREIVIHGGFNPPGVGAGTPGEIDGEAGFKLLLPVLAGEIYLHAVGDEQAVGQQVPLPAAAWMLLAGVGALGGAARLRRRRPG